MNSKCGQSDHRDDRLGQIILEYVDAISSGVEIDRSQFLHAHPEFHAELEDFFLNHDEIERVTKPFREQHDASIQNDHSAQTSFTQGEQAPNEPITWGAHRPIPGRLGEYRIIRELGRGGMGIVYEAEQMSLQRSVALKILPFIAAVDSRKLQRFKNEALAAANLRHEHIVTVYAVGCEFGVHYYAMQLIEGQSLADLIAEMENIKNEREKPRAVPDQIPQVPEEAKETLGRTHPGTTAIRYQSYVTGSRKHYDWIAKLGREAALALEYAHQLGVVHRDIKPANLLLDTKGKLWVTDFGLAQVAGNVGLTFTGEILGTLRYASPEQAKAKPGVVDHRSDIYSLAATLYELLTLRPLFDGTTPNQLLRQIADEDPPSLRWVSPNVPVELETILLKALSKDQFDRYATAEEFADDLKRYLDDKPIRARRPTRTERIRRWLRRHPHVIIGVLLFFCLTTISSLITLAVIHDQELKVKRALESERKRADEAESQYQLARRSVDELFRASEEELADRSDTAPLRQRLLTSVLSYYQEFIQLRHDAIEDHADLINARKRVQKILADLAAVRSMQLLRLLQHEAVLDDLHLSAGQRAVIGVLAIEFEQQYQDIMITREGQTPTERARQFLDTARGNELRMKSILSEEQLKRLEQICLQVDVLEAYRDPQVGAVLQLSEKQRENARTIEETMLWGVLRSIRSGKNPPEISVDPKTVSPNRKALELLTDLQLMKWHEMTGAIFPVEIPRSFPKLPTD